MSNLKWIKFYTSDWRSDIQLNLLTNTEKHIWIETLFLMAELEERGFLALNGESISVEKHAQLVRYRSKTVAHARQKWIKIGVCSVDSRGIIYSRRMVEETKKMLLDAINGKKGGNPNLMGLTPPLTHPLTDPLKQDTRYQILDTRKEKKKEKKKGVSTPFFS